MKTAANQSVADIVNMFDELNMPLSSTRLTELWNSPDLANYTPQQLLREVIEPQYTDMLNRRYQMNLQFSKLNNKTAQIDNIQTGNGRRYNDTTIQQLKTFGFADHRMNVGVYGKTGVGKTYFLAALCNEACRRNYRAKFIDYCELLDELYHLQCVDAKRYTTRLRYYTRIQLLFIDDFAINRYPEEKINILYQLIKAREDQQKSTIFSCQYAPDEWGQHLSHEASCYGKLDGIRRRLTTGYTVTIELT